MLILTLAVVAWTIYVLHRWESEDRPAAPTPPLPVPVPAEEPTEEPEEEEEEEEEEEAGPDPLDSPAPTTVPQGARWPV